MNVKRTIGKTVPNLVMACCMAGLLWCGIAAADGEDAALPSADEAYAVADVENATAYISAEHYVKPGFSSHLPIVLLEYPKGQNNEDNGMAQITIYEGMPRNTLNDAVANVALAETSSLGETENVPREKEDLYLQLCDEDGLPVAHSLLGMDKNNKYYLIGAQYDRSLLRNYLGYSLAAQAMDSAPSVRFCELLVRHEAGDLYQGVYLLVERKQIENAQVYQRTALESGTLLNTYGLIDHREDGYWTVPDTETMGEAELENASVALSGVDAVIYSTDLNTFSQYERLIDVGSFIDFFIVNEVMGNYTAKAYAYYYYNAVEKRLYMGPVWDFEKALDNDAANPMDRKSIQFSKDGYFVHLLQSRSFINQLRQRFLSLRKEVFSEDNYYALIDGAVEYLGPALQRDWQRWETFFTENEAMTLQPLTEEKASDGSEVSVGKFSRAAQTHAQEVIRLKYILREHDLYMRHQLSRLEVDIGASQIRGREASYVENGLLFLGVLVLLIFIIQKARKYAT